jgi:hypothetical protein
VTQIESAEAPEIAPELHGERLIEAKLLPELRDVPRVGGAGLTGEHIDHIAGSEVHKEEVEDCDADDG